MDWRHPNVGCLFHKENTKPDQSRDFTRYFRSVKSPPYGVSTKDFDRDHNPREWPPGTEYQYAYCSNYKDLLLPRSNKERHADMPDDMRDRFVQPGSQASERGLVGDQNPQSLYQLYEETPLPISDKHYRGAKYRVNDPIGVLVPEEVSRVRDTLHGPVRLSCQEDLNNVYVPNYRYKEWISRPMIEIKKELESNTLFCCLPEAPSQYWDFYNTIRMRRPSRKSETGSDFRPCSFLPLPMNKDVSDNPPAPPNPFLGKFNHFHTSETPFQFGNFSNRSTGIC